MLRIKRFFPLLFLLIVLLIGAASISAEQIPDPDTPDALPSSINQPYALAATCANSHDADGVPLDQCYGQTFTIGGNTRSVSIHYTTSQVHEGSPHNHWISDTNQVHNVADWAQEAWELYYEDAWNTRL